MYCTEYSIWRLFSFSLAGFWLFISVFIDLACITYVRVKSGAKIPLTLCATHIKTLHNMWQRVKHSGLSSHRRVEHKHTQRTQTNQRRLLSVHLYISTVKQQVRVEILIPEYDAHSCKQAIWDAAWKHNQMHENNSQKSIFTMKCRVLIACRGQIQLFGLQLVSHGVTFLSSSVVKSFGNINNIQSNETLELGQCNNSQSSFILTLTLLLWIYLNAVVTRIGVWERPSSVIFDKPVQIS